jgi:parallel beta-helix repeat protein
MKRKNSTARICAAFGLILSVVSVSSFAQATRTWVSGVGDDANPCSRTAPCKTFAGAISKTAAGGEINAIDPGGYGAVTITKSITIDGAGTVASVLASATNGIIVNAGANDVVILRNLSINGAGTTPGLNGIRFLAGAALHVENVAVFGFGQEGIEFAPSGNAQLFVKSSSFRKNFPVGSGGILIKPAVGFSVLAELDDVQFERNLYGLRAEAGSNVTVRNCVASGNVNNGFLMFGAGNLSISGCTISGNGTNATTGGIKSEGAGAVVRVGGSQINDNSVGLLPAGGGTIVSFGNNLLAGNLTDGNPSSTIPTR